MTLSDAVSMTSTRPGRARPKPRAWPFGRQSSAAGACRRGMFLMTLPGRDVDDVDEARRSEATKAKCPSGVIRMPSCSGPVGKWAVDLAEFRFETVASESSLFQIRDRGHRRRSKSPDRRCCGTVDQLLGRHTSRRARSCRRCRSRDEVLCGRAVGEAAGRAQVRKELDDLILCVQDRDGAAATRSRRRRGRSGRRPRGDRRATRTRKVSAGRMQPRPVTIASR